jgi:hypothetical protein
LCDFTSRPIRQESIDHAGAHLEAPKDPAPQLAAWVGLLMARDFSLPPQLAAIQRHLHANDLAATTCIMKQQQQQR